MNAARRASRGIPAALLALVATVAIAACGSSAKSTASSRRASTTTTTTARAAAAAFSACLKQHGVTITRRPGAARGTATTGGARGRGFFGGGPGGPGGAGGAGRPFGGNSKFAKAFAACRSKLPKGARGLGGFGTGRGPGGAAGRLRFSKQTLDAYVACIRKHGYPGMPAPNTSGKGPVFSRAVESNAKFQKADRSCVGILRQAFRPPGAPATTTSTTATTTSTAASA